MAKEERIRWDGELDFIEQDDESRADREIGSVNRLLDQDPSNFKDSRNYTEVGLTMGVSMALLTRTRMEVLENYYPIGSLVTVPGRGAFNIQRYIQDHSGGGHVVVRVEGGRESLVVNLHEFYAFVHSDVKARLKGVSIAGIVSRSRKAVQSLAIRGPLN